MIWIYLLILFAFICLSYKKPLAGISLLLPLIAAMAYFVGYLPEMRDEEIMYSLIITAMTFLGSLIAILISPKTKALAIWAKIIAEWMLTLTLVTIFQISVFIVFGAWGFLTLLFILLAGGLYISLKVSSKFSKPLFVLSTISAGMKQNLPLTMVLESACRGGNNKVAGIFKKINSWLIQGRPLSESIKLGYRLCPGYIPAMIEAGEKINQVPLAIEMLLADMMKKAKEKTAPTCFAPAYPVVVVTVAFLILLLLMKFIIPSFALVLEEMCDGAALPRISTIVFGISNFIAYKLWWQITLFFFLTVPIWICIKFRPRRPEKLDTFSRAGDWLKWHVPIIHWFEKNYSLLRTVEYLRLSMNVDSTIDEAIEGACKLDMNICFKKRLRKWLGKVRSGGDVVESARQARLGSLLPWALSGNDVEAGLEMVESSLRANYSYRVSLTKIIAEPMSIIILAGIVASVVLAVFLPMVSIVNHLAGQVIPS